MTDDEIVCPNCVSPFKCNGPHIGNAPPSGYEDSSMTTPTNDRQTSERERLATVVDDLGSANVPQWWTRKAADQLRAAEAEIVSLRAENEALRTDAERYRYMRDNACNSDGALVCWFDHDDGALGESVTFQGEHFDAAVDAIRSKESRRAPE